MKQSARVLFYNCSNSGLDEVICPDSHNTYSIYVVKCMRFKKQQPWFSLRILLFSCVATKKAYFPAVPHGLPRQLSGKESTCQCRGHGFDPWLGKIPWRRKWQPTPVFLPEMSHGQRSLVGYSLWGRKESDMTQ